MLMVPEQAEAEAVKAVRKEQEDLVEREVAALLRSISTTMVQMDI